MPHVWLDAGREESASVYGVAHSGQEDMDVSKDHEKQPCYYLLPATYYYIFCASLAIESEIPMRGQRDRRD